MGRGQRQRGRPLRPSNQPLPGAPPGTFGSTQGSVTDGNLGIDPRYAAYAGTGRKDREGPPRARVKMTLSSLSGHSQLTKSVWPNQSGWAGMLTLVFKRED